MSLPSSSSYELFISWHNLSFGSRAFQSHRYWTQCLYAFANLSLPVFKRHLKPHFFQLAYPSAGDPFSNAPCLCLQRLCTAGAIMFSLSDVPAVRCASSLASSVLHLSHCCQCSPTLNRQPYEGRLPLSNWWGKSSNTTVGQSSLKSLTHHCYDWHPGSCCG